MVVGAALVAAGTLIVAGNIWPFLSFARMWPLFLLIPVLFFVMALIQDGRSAAGVLIPTGILVFLAAYFLALNFTSWDHSGSTWPLYILAPVPGFLAYFFVTRQKGALYPALVLTAVTVVSFGLIRPSGTFAAVILILAGILLLVKSFLPARTTGNRKNKNGARS